MLFYLRFLRGRRHFTNRLLFCVSLYLSFTLPASGATITKISPIERLFQTPLANHQQLSAMSRGIGGLQVSLAKSASLRLNPADIHYANGTLVVTLDNRLERIDIAPDLILEAFDLATRSDLTEYQASIDLLAVNGLVKYTTPELKKHTRLANLFLMADIDFSAFFQQSRPLPGSSIRHFYDEAIQRLKTDDKYRQLARQWPQPPTSWPQIFISFDPSVSGLVLFDAKPQLMFLSSAEQALEVSPADRETAEIPYQPLIDHVRNYPAVYRANSPLLEKVSSIAATMGVLRSACRDPGRCAHLLAQIENGRRKLEDSLGDSYWEPPQQGSELLRHYDLEFKMIEFTLAWRALAIRAFTPSDKPESWAAAFDTVRRTMEKLKNGFRATTTKQAHKSPLPLPPEVEQEVSRHENRLRLLVADLDEKEGDAWENTKKQFSDFDVPDSSLLQAAFGVVLAINADFSRARDRLEHAMNLASGHSGDQVQIAVMASFVALLAQTPPNIVSDDLNSALDRLARRVDTARTAAYDTVSAYLDTCTKSIKNCSELDLRHWEADAGRALLLGKLEGRDLAWLHGRFCYLIGIRLADPVARADRLRVLAAYREKASKEHQSALSELENTLAVTLGGKTHRQHAISWALALVALGIILMFAYRIIFRTRRLPYLVVVSSHSRSRANHQQDQDSNETTFKA